MKLQIQEDRIEKQTHINAPIARVWRALTDHHEFGQWFGVKIDGPFVADETSSGQMTIPGYEEVKWEVVVQEIDAERFVFAYSWHPYAIGDGARLLAGTIHARGVPAQTERRRDVADRDGIWIQQTARRSAPRRLPHEHSRLGSAAE